MHSEPSSDRSLLAMGDELLELREPALALNLYNRAWNIGADPVACAARRWTCWMLLGDLARAWRESDLIDTLAVKSKTQLWDGSSFRNKRVLVRCLHGFGDAVQFIRYACMLREQAAKVIVQAHPALVNLLRTSNGIDEAITWPDPPDGNHHWDQQIEVMELPRAFRTTLATIPAKVPYLFVPPARVLAAEQTFAKRDKLRIGIIWKSSSYDPNRDISPSLLIPAILSHGCELYSLQHGLSTIELLELQRQYGLRILRSFYDGVIGTAAYMRCMDLIISVDTFAAHLAGALAVPTWVLLPFAADWRWMLQRSDSPWYPSMRLWRQESPGDWYAVVEKIRPALTTLLFQLS